MDLHDYPVRICVAGSRSFHDKHKFDTFLRVFLSWAGVDPYAFISGDASRGPDRMIIDWAKYHDKPCFKFTADWENLGKGAGFIRNAEMRKHLTHLLVFWDGESRGTKEMIEKTMLLENIHISLIKVKPDQEWIKQQKFASGTEFSTKRFKAKHHGWK